MSNYNFATVPKAGIQRSSFDRSHNWKGTFDAGKLIPFFVDEVLPGDTFNLNVSLLCRMATPIVPVMDTLYLDTFFFFVPNRLVWNNWQKMMGEREDPDDSIDFLVPTAVINISGSSPSPTSYFGSSVEVNSVLDYMGIPINVTPIYMNLLPLRSYYLIWSEWFRDENLQDYVKISKGDSGLFSESIPNSFSNPIRSGSCLPRGKRHDYFTSALPWPQKGDAVDIPLGTSAPVGMYKNHVSGSSVVSDPLGAGSTFYGIYESDVYDTQSGTQFAAVLNQTVGSENETNMFADLTQATAATINSLRAAFQVQKLLENDARGGTRYTEILRSHFNVISPDGRLQRPEYLGGSSTPFMINPVAQTTSTDATTPQGNLAAFGIASHHGNGFVKSFVEHGYIIGLCSVRADLNYQQGLNRMWSRKTRYDFYWPELAHLGEQTVLNKEIMLQGTSDDDEVFGYQERFAEYRYFPNLITGEFRSTYSAPLDSWHLAQKFTTLPTLSSDFIKEDPPIDRVIAVPSEPQFLMDAYFKLNCVRPMPLYGTPGLIDHF